MCNLEDTVARRAINPVVLPVAAGSGGRAIPGEAPSMVGTAISQREREMIAVRMDYALSGETLEGYKPAESIWLRFLKEKKPGLYTDPFLKGLGVIAIEEVLMVFICWLGGQMIDDTEPVDEDEGIAAYVDTSTVARQNNIVVTMQGLAHLFMKNSGDTSAFGAKNVLAVRGSFRKSAREVSAIRIDNEKTAASWEMIEYVSSNFFDRIKDGDSESRPVEAFKIGKNKTAEKKLDVMNTALAVEYMVVNTSRISEVAHTGPAKGHDIEDKHAVRDTDVHFMVEDASGEGCLVFSNDLPVGIKQEHILQLTMYLYSNKADQLGTKTRISTVTPDSERARAFIGRMLHWALARGVRASTDLFFSRTYLGKEKKLTSAMVNKMWDILEDEFGLPEGTLSSKSAKKLAADMALKNSQGGLRPEDTFHASASAQGHYLSRQNYGSGSSVVLVDGKQGLSTEQVKAAAGLLSKPTAGAGAGIVLK